MVYSEYYNYIYGDICNQVNNEINVTTEELRVLHEKKLIHLFMLKPKQKFVYKIVELYEKGLCELTECKWLDTRKFFTYINEKPVLHYDNIDCKNYGDLAECDGSHTLTIINFTVEIKVKNISEWKFTFDENNEESRKAFYDYFRPFLYKEFINLLIKERIEEIHNEEIKKLNNIAKNLIDKNCHESI